jgi:hypothetical protein
VVAGFGICCVVPSKLLFAPPPDMVVRPLSEPFLTFRGVLIWLRDNKQAVLERYVEVARELRESSQLT